MKRRPPPLDDRDVRIRNLEDDLYMARQAIINLMPEHIRSVLAASTWCETVDEVLDWERWAVDRFLDFVELLPGHERDEFPRYRRANCPLCRGEASTPYNRGYAVPEGLTRHLRGSHGNHRCDVVDAAYQQARARALRIRDQGAPRLRPFGKDRPPSAWEQDRLKTEAAAQAEAERKVAAAAATPRTSAVILQFKQED